MQTTFQTTGRRRLQVPRRHQLADAGRLARRPRLRAQHPRRRIERRDAGEPRLLGRQRRVRHRARARAARCSRRRSATSRSTTTCAKALAAGHRFNCGVVYLPPSAARDGVAELIRVNPELRKIFIITEKISVHDAREIRAMGQQNGIDIFGANGLGVADSWNQVRIGGALGGDKPGDSLRQRLDRDLLQLGRLLDHHRAVPAHGRLGHDDRDLQRQGRLHPLRRARVRLRARQRRAQQGGGAVLRARRLLRARRAVHQAGGGLRGRPLEEQAHARGRPCRRDGRRRRRRAGQGTLVHGEVRRRRASSRPTTRCSRPRARW